jgi:hypothetical protein
VRKTKFTEEQMMDALQQLEAGRRAKGLARELAITDQTLHCWPAKYSGLDVNEAQRLSLARRGEPALEGAGGRSEPGQRNWRNPQRPREATRSRESPRGRIIAPDGVASERDGADFRRSGDREKRLEIVRSRRDVEAPVGRPRWQRTSQSRGPGFPRRRRMCMMPTIGFRR